jgi:hypothetical protein
MYAQSHIPYHCKPANTTPATRAEVSHIASPSQLTANSCMQQWTDTSPLHHRPAARLPCIYVPAGAGHSEESPSLMILKSAWMLLFLMAVLHAQPSSPLDHLVHFLQCLQELAVILGALVMLYQQVPGSRYSTSSTSRSLAADNPVSTSKALSSYSGCSAISTMTTFCKQRGAIHAPLAMCSNVTIATTYWQELANLAG